MILRTASRVRILATSREPLRAEGEWLHRLPPLEIPPDRVGLTADEALSHSAARLFSERALECGSDFSLSDADAPALCEICRKLDGLPLAIELAAVQVEVLGIQGLARVLDHRFAILTRGRRTALARQQTLRATIDWSHDLLSETEKTVLRRLGIFRGDFTMDAARAVVGDGELSGAAVVDCVANLAAKSLVTTDIGGDVTYHRLLDTTRTYVLEKLTESVEIEALHRRHARSLRTGRSGERDATAGRMAGCVRAASRQCARCARLGIFCRG
jgi:predicted ATPase